MTQLAWRDVAAPDFSSAMLGLKDAAGLFDKAGSGLSQTFGDINSIKNTDAARQFDLNLAHITDPEALKAAQADGSIYNGVNVNRLSPDQINSTVGRVTSLLSNQSDLLKNKDSESLLGLNTKLRGIQGTDAESEVAARPHQAALMRIAMDPKFANDPTGGQAAISQFYKENPEAAAALAKLPYANQLSNFTDIQNLARNGLSNIGAATGNSSAGLTLQSSLDDRSAEALAGIVRRSGTGIRDWSQILDDPEAAKKYGVSQNVIERARKLVIGDPTGTADFVASNGNPPGGATGMGGGGGGGGPANLQAALGMTLGGGQLPQNVQTVSDAIAAGKAGVAAGQKSNPMGIYQMMGGTMAQYAPMAGVPLNANFRDFNTQDKIAEQIFMHNKGSNEALTSQWTSLNKLPPEQVAKIRAMPWSEARNFIAKGEVGIPDLNAVLGNRENLVAVNTNLGQNQTGSPAQRTARLLADARTDDSSPMSVAGKLTGKGGDFEGENTRYVSQAVDELVQQSHGRISPAQAGLILQQSAHGEKNFFHRWASKGFGGDGLNTYIDHDRASELIKLASDPNALNAAAVANDTNSTTAGMAAQGTAMLQQAISDKFQAQRAAYLAGRPFDSKPYDAAIQLAQGYAQGGMGIATQAAGAGNPPPPVQMRPRSAPVPAGHTPAGNVPQGALNAQAYLNNIINQRTQNAGPAQKPMVLEQISREWGVPVSQIRNPLVAWKVAKMLDARTAAASAPSDSSNFRR